MKKMINKKQKHMNLYYKNQKKFEYNPLTNQLLENIQVNRKDKFKSG